MKHFVKVKDYRWFPGSTKKMIYEDEDGKLFLGPPFNTMLGEILLVEASDRPIDGYYHIIKLVAKIPPKK